MPRKIEHKTTRRRQDGYVYEYFEPHSPFQRLLAAAMDRKQLSLRRLAEVIDVPASTLWLWLHHKSGVPGPRTFRGADHIPLLATQLGLTVAEIQEAYDLSLLVFHQSSIPTPLPQREALADLISILEQRTTRTVNRDWLLRLARRLHAGAEIESAGPPAPESKKPSARSKGEPPKKKRGRKK